jgi:hypothetical protein
MRRVGFVGVLAFAAGCPSPLTLVLDSGGGSDESSTGDGEDTTDGGSNQTATVASADDTTGADVTSGTTGPGDSTGVPPTTDGTDGCPPGALGCPCDVGSSCDGELMCVDGTCVEASACQPLDVDPHDTEGTAFDLPLLMCGMSLGTGPLGTIDGIETDWYAFFGDDALGCAEQPTAIVTAAEPLDVCIFLECASGSPLGGLACPVGTDLDMSPSGRIGCCGVSEAAITDYACMGSKDANVWISIGSSADTCTDYELTYEF